MNAETRSQHKHAIEQDVSECIIATQRSDARFADEQWIVRRHLFRNGI